MVAGHLQEKSGYYYVVLNYKDSNGKRRSKWISTKLPIKGNKKRAEQLLLEERANFIIKEELEPATETMQASLFSNDMLFCDFLKKWLEIAKPTVSISTYCSYVTLSQSVIIPYFKREGITLSALKPINIQCFYMEQLKRVKATTVIHYHAIIHRALKYAVKIELLLSNPADRVERPRKEKFVGAFYDSSEIKKLFEITKGTKLELPVFLGAFYGLRRSEAIGLKWDAIDFDNDTITIMHTVTACRLDGKLTEIKQDATKTASSMRTLPLVPIFKEMLTERKVKQEYYQKIFGKSYNKNYLDYICVDEIGNIISPNYVTTAFSKLLEKNGMRHIRYHDLRHSCASLMLANGVPMKQIQEWLGHSDFSTTANIYAHLDYHSKQASADAMIDGLSDALTVYG